VLSKSENLFCCEVWKLKFFCFLCFQRGGFWRNGEGEEVIKAEIGSSQNLLCAKVS
jgi:hypothetical protein